MSPTLELSSPADLREKLIAIADKFGIESIRHEAASGSTQGDPVLAVVGEFSSGKSTLVNFLVRRAVMPVAVEPTTQFPVELRYGETTEYGLERPGGDAEAVPAGTFEAAASPSGVAGTYAIGTIRLPSPFLARGLMVVDTPGVASATELHEDITFGYLPRADAILVVLNAVKGVPESLLEFLRESILPQEASRLVFVANFLGQNPESDWEGMIARVTTDLEKVVPSPLVLPVTLAKTEATSFDVLTDAARERAGLTGVETALHELLVVRRQEVLEARESRRLRALGLQLDSYLATYKSGLDAESDESIVKEIEGHRTELGRVRQELREQRGKLKSDADVTVQRLDGALEARFKSVGAVAHSALQEEFDAPGVGGTLEERLTSASPTSFSSRVSDATRKQIAAFGKEDLAPTLKALEERWVGEVRDGLDRTVDGEDHDFTFDTSNPLAPYVESALDVALIFLLNVVLPGGFLVAIIGRVAGEKMVEKIRKPLLTTIERLILDKVAAPMAARAILAQIDTQLVTVRGNVMKQVREALGHAADKLTENLEGRFETARAEREGLLEDARRRRDTGVEKVRAARESATDARRDLAILLA